MKKDERYVNPLLKKDTAPEIAQGRWVRVGGLALLALGVAWAASSLLSGENPQSGQAHNEDSSNPGGN